VKSIPAIVEPRDWTDSGIELGIPQIAYGGYVNADWPSEVVRTHRVYFVRAGEPDENDYAPVKIGFTTNVEERMRQLQTACPSRLTVLELVIGTQVIEAFFHRLLRKRRIHGEWYTLSTDDISYAHARLWEEGLSWW
jgi:hypothetical protein